jgi:hypothetical protein
MHESCFGIGEPFSEIEHFCKIMNFLINVHEQLVDNMNIFFSNAWFILGTGDFFSMRPFIFYYLKLV